MRFLSLFAGIGGLDLGLERAGMECVGQVEWDSWCQQILTKHWPDIPKWEDIHDFNQQAADSIGPIDLIAGGFPCQPVSTAGKRLAQDDPRWLWPEFFRIVRMVRPRYVLVENVPGLLTAGFGDIAADLASIGYDFEWTRLSAAAVGAPHLRQRIFIVGYPDGAQATGREGTGRTVFEPGAVERPERSGGRGGAGNVAYPDSIGSGRLRRMARDPDRQGREPAATGTTGVRPGTRRPQDNHPGPGGPVMADTDSGRRGRLRKLEPGGVESSRRHVFDRCGPVRELLDPAAARRWAPEPPVGRVAYGIPRRVDRLRGLGNAVVPQVAETIGHMIMAAE